MKSVKNTYEQTPYSTMYHRPGTGGMDIIGSCLKTSFNNGNEDTIFVFTELFYTPQEF